MVNQRREKNVCWNSRSLLLILWLVLLAFMQQGCDTAVAHQKYVATAPLPLHEFLKTTYAKALLVLWQRYSPTISKFGNENGKDSSSTDKVLRLQYFHSLFTNNSCSNSAVFGAFRIPYFWHWVSPNPRFGITYTPTGQKLDKVKAPKGFEKYANLASIDRIPSIYLADLTSDKPLYYNSTIDSFYTFGWCSEREMAFLCLMSIYGYEGKIVFSGAHVWSEFLIKSTAAEVATYAIVYVDNTFDAFSWKAIEEKAIAEWRKPDGNNKTNAWYNSTANQVRSKVRCAK